MKKQIFSIETKNGIDTQRLDHLMDGLSDDEDGNEFIRAKEIEPDFEKGYNILMDYFDELPEDIRQEVSDELDEVGC